MQYYYIIGNKTNYTIKKLKKNSHNLIFKNVIQIF